MRPPHRVPLLLLALLATATCVPIGLPSARADDSAPVAIPDVATMSRADARAALLAKGLLMAVTEVAGDPPDSVLDQAPSAGSAAVAGAVVVVRVRRADVDMTAAPRAIGLTSAQASTTLGSLYSLRFLSIVGAPADAGKVVAQSPPFGQPLALRGLLSLSVVSDPSQTATVTAPDLHGMTTAEALEMAAGAGLNGRVAEVYLPGAVVGRVVGQVPDPATTVDRLSPLTAIVAAAEPPTDGDPVSPTLTVAVPNLLGKTQSEAEDALLAVGFSPNALVVPWPGMTPLLVFAQKELPGTLLFSGSTVTFRVAKPATAPAAALVPNVMGSTESAAKDALATAGYVAKVVLTDQPPQLVGTVVDQLPAAGTPRPLGMSVVIRVGRFTPPAGPQPSDTPLPDAYRKVPNVVGFSKANANDVLKAEGFAPAFYAGTPSGVAVPGLVYGQSPAAGQGAPVGSTVHVQWWPVKAADDGGGGVSANLPAAVRVVPDVIGWTQAAAVAAIKAEAFFQVKVMQGSAAGTNILPGSVLQQSPKGGTGAQYGTVVTIVILAKSALSPNGDAGGAPATTKLPKVISMQQGAAISALKAAGFTHVAVKPGTPPVDIYAPGSVFEQQPTAGSVVDPQTTITISVKPTPAASPLVKLPKVVGSEQVKATAKLDAAGFHHVAVKFGKSPDLDLPTGSVFDQQPAAGSMIDPKTTITLSVSGKVAGPALSKVPSVVGASQFAATIVLNGGGFKNIVVTKDAAALGVPVGQVISQKPAAGASADPAAAVTIVVKGEAAAPGALLKAPNLTGMTLEGAMAALSSAGFKAIHAEPGAGPGAAPGVAPGHVAAQDPKAGLFADPKSPFRFWLNGPPPGYVTVPQLVGKKSTDVGAALKNAGLSGNVTIDPSPKNAIGVVLTQSPKAGTWTKPGAMVQWSYRAQ